MKFFYSLIFLCFLLPVFSQTDSIQFSYEVENWEGIKDIDYVSNYWDPTVTSDYSNTVLTLSYDYLFSPNNNSFIDKKVKHSFNNGSALQINLEQRIKDSWTFGAGVTLLEPNEFYKLGKGITGWNTELRWYVSEHQRIKNGLGKGLLKGKYYGIRFDGNKIDISRFLRNSNPLKSYQLLFNIGDRYHLGFKHGKRINYLIFFESRIGIRYQELLGSAENEYPIIKRWGLAGEVRTGFSFYLNKGDREEKMSYEFQRCDIMLCHDERNQLFKFDFINALPNAFVGELNGALGIGYERRIGSGFFTLNNEFRFDFQWFDYPDERKDIEVFSPSLEMEPRYYFLQKRKIAKGSGVKDLNGLFVGLNFQGKKQFGEDRFYDEKLAVTPNIGLQITLGRLFIEGKVGLGVATRSDNEEELFDRLYGNYIFVYKFGYSF